MVLPSMETEATAGRKRYDPLTKMALKCYSTLFLNACFISKQVSVLKGAPETVQELLSTLGLQKYTLGLSLSGWDDLDYFR